MGIVDPNNRKQTPIFMGGSSCLVAHAFRYLSKNDLNRIDEIIPGFWQSVYECYTHPTPIRNPKYFPLYGISHLVTFSREGWYADWPDKWWNDLADSFMFPEYLE